MIRKSRIVTQKAILWILACSAWNTGRWVATSGRAANVGATYGGEEVAPVKKKTDHRHDDGSTFGAC